MVLDTAWRRRRRQSRLMWMGWALLMVMLTGFLVADSLWLRRWLFLPHAPHGLEGEISSVDGETPGPGVSSLEEFPPDTTIPVENLEEAPEPESLEGISEPESQEETPEPESSEIPSVSAHIHHLGFPGAKASLPPPEHPDAPEVPDIGGPSHPPPPPPRETEEQRERICLLNSVPEKATVFRDGQAVGITPHRLVLSPRQSTTIRLELSGHQSQEFQLSWPPPSRLVKRLTSLPMGALRLRYFPATAEVFIDGRAVPGKDGLNIIETRLPVGEHQVTLRWEGREETQTVQIHPDTQWRGTMTVTP